MNHWQLVEQYIGKTIEANGRLLLIKGPSVPGNAFCEAVDGGKARYEVSTAFLQPENVKA